MFAINKVWDQVSSPKINFLRSAAANGRPLPLRKVARGSDE